MSRKPYKNETPYDPGRFSHKIRFFNLVSTRTNSGGSIPTPVSVLNTFAVKEKIKEYTAITLLAGQTIDTGDCAFVIRNRAGFYPTKSMRVNTDSDTYEIMADPVKVDDPIRFIRLYCKRLAKFTPVTT